jgi:hypothetical protein
MAKEKAKPKAKPRGNPNFVPDLLGVHVDIEVIRTGPDGKNVKKLMKYGDWKKMVKQRGFVYRAYQIGVSQYDLKN